MKENKLVLTQELIDELSNMIKVGSDLENKGKKIRMRAENILMSYATYGVETPSKRNKRLLNEMRKTSAYTPFN